MISGYYTQDLLKWLKSRKFSITNMMKVISTHTFQSSGLDKEQERPFAFWALLLDKYES